MALGGKGVISVFSNALPGTMHQLADAMLKGDLESARKLNSQYLDLMDGFFMDVNPIPIKEALYQMGAYPEPLLPHAPDHHDGRGQGQAHRFAAKAQSGVSGALVEKKGSPHYDKDHPLRLQTARWAAAVQNFASQREDCSIVAGVDVAGQSQGGFPVYASLQDVQEEAQVVVDFSHPSALSSILEYCRSHPGTAAVLCTTGYSAQQTQEIQEAAKELPLFYSRNMSLGVNLLIELAKKAEAVLGDSFDVEIVEMHHNQKIDAPSGTALMIADAINQVREDSMQYVYDRHSQRKKREKKEIGLHSVRGGTIVGEHQVIFAGQSEVLTLSHSAQSKELFAAGAVNAAVFMAGKGPGLYDMSHLI